ncbi:hypothetical protein BWQ96_03571 [Gracilariopsis chorda]|uniref:Uncharacterized protein n=1 Tax=Gracilariopsis chorda TaxID=448386 RepID=A0A2V3IWR5_9FLOR|nr:hypothetical protein BWQ96_03571 [Gracilariopsis chorda]|eukprot:PXF46582.1 hypothetical protein BWQ96_03571 [Gracilariopsis chorda]
MAPVPLSRLVRQQTPSCSQATDLELALITASIVISFFLYALPIKVSSKMYEKGRRPFVFSFSFLFLAVSATGVSIAAIVLGHNRTISLDAIVAVVFALTPGLVSFPRDVFTDLYVYLVMRLFRVFPTNYNHFCYITMGSKCKEGMRYPGAPTHQSVPSKHQDPKLLRCGMARCEATFYVRHFRRPTHLWFPRMKLKLWSRQSRLASIFDFFSGHPPQYRWDGIVMNHTTSVVVLRNLSSVPEEKWFLSLTRSLWFVMQPWVVHLNTPSQVGQALRLISDIVAIGRLVLHYRGDYIRRELDTLDLYQNRLAFAAIQVCNAVVSEMGITEWRELDLMQIRLFAEAPNFRGREGTVYSILFFYLTMKSKLFGEWSEWTGGPEETSCLEEEPTGMTPPSWSSTHAFIEESGIHNSNDTTSSTAQVDSDYDDERTISMKKLKRSLFISTFVQWAGFFVNGTIPFRHPGKIAAFRYKLTSHNILREVMATPLHGQGLDVFLRGRVDTWLGEWDCNVRDNQC